MTRTKAIVWLADTSVVVTRVTARLFARAAIHKSVTSSHQSEDRTPTKLRAMQ